MLPSLFLFNEVSLDGLYTAADFGRYGYVWSQSPYYQIALDYPCDAVLFGSETAGAAFPEWPEEDQSDWEKPVKSGQENLPYFVIPDSKGKLKNRLHVYRRMEFGRDVIILVSPNTPPDYLQYLQERNYDYVMAGDDYVNYREAFEHLFHDWNIKVIRSDSGGILNSILVDQELVDEIILLITPCILGGKSKTLFQDVQKPVRLRLLEQRDHPGDYVILRYQVLK